MVPGWIPCDATVYKQMDHAKSLTEHTSLRQDSCKLNKDKNGESTKKKKKTKPNPIFCTFQFWLLFNIDYTKLWNHMFIIQKMYFYISVW